MDPRAVQEAVMSPTLQEALILAAEKSGIADPEKLRAIKHAMDIRKLRALAEERQINRMDSILNEIKDEISQDSTLKGTPRGGDFL
jgi:hypothetical protein